MRDYGRVFSSIWSSADFRALSEDGRNLVLYLLTSPHGTISGCFRLPDGYVCEDMQWSSERVAEGFRELFEKGFANRCGTSKWVWICKFMEWNPPENPNQRKAAAKQAQQIPADCAWKLAFMRICGPTIGLDPGPEDGQKRNGHGTLPEPFLNQYQYQEQYQEQENTHTAGARSAAESTGPPSSAGRVCFALRQIGLGDVNPGHPDLLALLAAGATEAEFIGAAQGAVDRGKGFAYALGTLKRQRVDAKNAARDMHRGALPRNETAGQRASRERVEAAVPNLAARREIPPPMEVVDVAPRLLG